MAVITKDLGAVSSYALAVENGYTGTEAEWIALIRSTTTSAQTAVDAKDAALVAKTAAETAATQAAGSATAAASSASGASGSASAAAESATAAAGSATSAGSSATAAAGSATAAAGSASSASSSATAASGSATAASGSATTAETAKTAAQTAQAGAEAAQAAAEAVLESIPEDYSEMSADVSALKSQIQQKANIDGYYESMTVGNAEQLVATVGVEDNAPYNFRTAGGSADIGDRLVDKLVGGTIAWNQLIPDGRAISPSYWNARKGTLVAGETESVYTMSEWTSDATIVRGVNYSSPDHVFFYTADINPAHSKRIALFLVNYSGNTSFGKDVTANTWNTACKVLKMSTPNNLREIQLLLNCTEANGYAVGDQDKIRNVMLIDLTKMFGSTIADYIYSLEQATEGAGVAWFRHLFPKPYYAYNPGELMSVQAASHKTVGFNAWDKENQPLYSGNFDSAGGNINVCVDGYIRVVPGMQYEFAHKNGTGVYQGQYLRFYDANKNLLSESTITSYSTNSITFTVPENAYYVRFMFYNGNGLTPAQIYALDVCLHLVWDGERDGEYEEYTEHVYPLDDSLTLRGIPKLDAANNLYYDGDTYESDGTVTRRYKQNQMTYEWLSARDENGIGYDSNRGAVWVRNWNYADMEMRSGGINALCNAFDVSVMDSSIQSTQYRIYFFGQTDVSSFLTKVQALETAGSGLYLVYELAEPTTETADPFQNPQIVDDFGTEEYVDAGVTAATPTRDVAIPVGHETTYQANLRAKLEMAPDSPSDGDGDYIVRQTNGTNEYAKLVIPTELPTNPTTDGTYHLKATVSGGTTTLTWEADT